MWKWKLLKRVEGRRVVVVVREEDVEKGMVSVVVEMGRRVEVVLRRKQKHRRNQRLLFLFLFLLAWWYPEVENHLDLEEQEDHHYPRPRPLPPHPRRNPLQSFLRNKENNQSKDCRVEL